MAHVTHCSSGPVISVLYGAYALVLLASAGCATPRTSEGKSSDVGRVLSLSAPDLAGGEIDVGAQRGHVRIVDFWATWCEPCKEALPALDALARDLAPRGLAVYAVSIDADRAQLARFLAERPIAVTVLWDEGAVRVSGFHVKYMPITLLVDRAGVIRHVHQGWEPAQAELQRRQVEALLAEGPPSVRAP